MCVCVWSVCSLWELRLWTASILLKYSGNQNKPSRLSEYCFPYCFVCCKSIDSARAQLSESSSLCLSHQFHHLQSSQWYYRPILSNIFGTQIWGDVLFSAKCKEEVVTVPSAGDLSGQPLSDLSLLESRAKPPSTNRNSSGKGAYAGGCGGSPDVGSPA